MGKIIHFSEAATIGIHALVVLARENKSMNAIELSERIGPSKFHIGKVLQRLVKDGLLNSSRGPTGGFSIRKDPAEISIYDVYRSIEGEIDYGSCPYEDKICPFNKCIRDNIIKKMSLDFVAYLKENTIQDYI
jgi:Rrf2 family protein